MTTRQTGNVTIFLSGVRIEGEIFTMREYKRGRLSDALNREKEQFLPVTNARVYEYESEEPVVAEKLLFINKNHILYAKPAVPKEKNE